MTDTTGHQIAGKASASTGVDPGTTEPVAAAYRVSDTADQPVLPNSCRGCDTRWAGTSPAHCPSCHVTFSGPSAFDTHRIRNSAAGGCRNPVAVGIVEHQRAGYAVWGRPADNENVERLRALRTQAEEAS